MRLFELSSKTGKGGKKRFKIGLLEIQPDICVVNNVGTSYNDNGITWIEKYCLNAVETIKGMSLTCEFLDDNRTEILGHGMTGYSDGIPIFENATVIGHFDGYSIEVIEGKKILVSTGIVDVFRYKNLVDKLETMLNNGDVIHGSVEIYKTDNNNAIQYLNGNGNEKGRIPTEFIFSGFALLGIKPADDAAVLLELNQKEESIMDEKVMAQFVDSIKATIIETNSKNGELNAKVEELSAECKKKEDENNELKGAIDVKDKELGETKTELEKKEEEIVELKSELQKLRDENKSAELNAALSAFTDEQKKFASQEIEQFKNNPSSYEINSIITKIQAESYKKMIEAKKTTELNSFENKTENIFSDVFDDSNEEYCDIY